MYISIPQLEINLIYNLPNNANKCARPDTQRNQIIFPKIYNLWEIKRILIARALIGMFIVTFISKLISICMVFSSVNQMNSDSKDSIWNVKALFQIYNIHQEKITEFFQSFSKRWEGNIIRDAALVQNWVSISKGF